MPYDVKLQKVRSGFDGHSFWGQARGGAIPRDEDQPATVVVTAQPTLRSGSDVYYEICEWRSTDLGRTWHGPVHHAETLGRRQEPDGVTVAICDMTPAWHAQTGKLLATGHTVRYRNDKHPIVARRRETAYSVYDAASHTWTPWTALDMPNHPRFAACGAGSTQRVDCEDGAILLPVYCKPVSDNKKACHSSTVVRCAFDGQRLTYLENGIELTVRDPRGLCEPSLTRFGGRYFLTMRNDVRGYVSASDDGLHFDDPRPWRFDDGAELGNYNTQQHWLTGPDTLYLVYTRRGPDNDHVFRHRAPLLMARVDPDELVVLRDTEHPIVPERGARLGNFGVCPVSPRETWVIAAEWMQPVGCEKHGSDNTIWVARILWH